MQVSSTDGHDCGVAGSSGRQFASAANANSYLCIAAISSCRSGQPDMPPPLLLLQNISVTFGTKALLSGAVLAVGADDRICLVGRNGSGKSTLLRIAAGLVEPDGGERFAQP